jgi:methylmalonyl-CoA mutase
VAAHTARASFAKNLFEAGGIAGRSGTGGTVDVVVAEFAASGTGLVCICSSDSIYAEQAAAAATALKSAGAARVYLAGRPGEQQGSFEAAGVDEFVFVGCDVLDVLGRALDTVGVA